MTRSIVQQLVKRAIGDAAFRSQLREDPQTALRGFDLTPDERNAITSADSGRLSALGVDQRMSKVFAAGALEATKSAFGDLGGSTASAAVIPPTHLQMVENDIQPLTTASSDSDSLIAGAPTHLQMVEGAFDASSASAVGGAPTHLQMVEGAFDTSGSSVINDSQPDDRLYFAGGTAGAPTADASDSTAHLQRLERDLDLGSQPSATAFEDHSGIGPVLEGGSVDPGAGSSVITPDVNFGNDIPSDQ